MYLYAVLNNVLHQNNENKNQTGITGIWISFCKESPSGKISAKITPDFKSCD